MTRGRNTYRLLMCCVALLAHSYTLLWGAGHHLHVLAEADGMLVVHAHASGSTEAFATASLHIERHQHTVKSLTLTGFPARISERAPIPQISDAPSFSPEADRQVDRHPIAGASLESPLPVPLDGHSPTCSGLDPPLIV
jgi:hypothetical protein